MNSRQQFTFFIKSITCEGDSTEIFKRPAASGPEKGSTAPKQTAALPGRARASQREQHPPLQGLHQDPFALTSQSRGLSCFADNPPNRMQNTTERETDNLVFQLPLIQLRSHRLKGLQHTKLYWKRSFSASIRFTKRKPGKSAQCLGKKKKQQTCSMEQLP